jgi:glycosyltransferase involved in cell wall biosynthesis
MARGFAQAAQSDPSLRLILLGNGSQARMVQQIIEQNGLRERVYLGGQVSQVDLPGIYRAADLYASASHSDGSSVSLMEALASGCPALVSDIPGNREWVTPGEQGWLFTDGDESALARGILLAAELARAAPEQLAQMRRDARLAAEQRADWSKNFQVLLQAYQAARDLSQRKV